MMVAAERVRARSMRLLIPSTAVDLKSRLRLDMVDERLEAHAQGWLGSKAHRSQNL